MQPPVQVRPPRRSLDATFYPPSDAARLAQIRLARLQAWVRMGVVTPSRRCVAADRTVISEGFSLGDVGYLHLLRHLRDDKDVPLEEAVSVLRSLMQRYGPPSDKWRESTLAVVPTGRRGRHLFISDAPDDWGPMAAIPGTEGASQKIWEYLVEFLPERVSLESILVPPQFLDFVEINPRKADGLPVARGTSIRTATIRLLLDTMSMDEFHNDIYPHIPTETAIACLRFERSLDRAA